MTSDVIISAANEKKTNWKVADMSTHYSGESLIGISDLFNGVATSPIYTFRDSNKILLTVDMQKKKILLFEGPIMDSGYSVESQGIFNKLLQSQIDDLTWKLSDTQMKLGEKRWALGEIQGMIDAIRIAWNTARFPDSQLLRCYPS